VCIQCGPGRFGATGTPLTVNTCSGPCSAGYACPAGSTNNTAIVCVAGQYSVASSGSCTQCPAGTYGTGDGLSACTGVCSAGFACPAGSTTPTATECPAGQYSTEGAASCIPCPSGSYGETPRLSTAVEACNGTCAPGYACGPGSTNGTASPCPAGQYSTEGASTCLPCPAGRYGGAPAMPNSSCTGGCSPGFTCPAGSTNGTASACPAGQYSTEGASTCLLCPAGRFGGAPAMPNSSCTGGCDAGRYGALPGLVSSGCSGQCSPGYVCSVGSVVDTALACPPGTFSPTGAVVCTPCDSGFYAGEFARPTPCVLPCPIGSWCPPGTSTPRQCPAGRYGAAARLTTENCTCLKSEVHCVSRSGDAPLGCLSRGVGKAGGWGIECPSLPRPPFLCARYGSVSCWLLLRTGRRGASPVSPRCVVVGRGGEGWDEADDAVPCAQGVTSSCTQAVVAVSPALVVHVRLVKRPWV
jgi:hypothetical protein